MEPVIADLDAETFAAALAAQLGEVKAEPLAKIAALVAEHGAPAAQRLLREAIALHHAADAQEWGAALTLEQVTRLATGRARWALRRKDGARRTLGGVFFSLSEQAKPKPKPKPVSTMAPAVAPVVLAPVAPPAVPSPPPPQPPPHATPSGPAASPLPSRKKKRAPVVEHKPPGPKVAPIVEVRRRPTLEPPRERPVTPSALVAFANAPKARGW